MVHDFVILCGEMRKPVTLARSHHRAVTMQDCLLARPEFSSKTKNALSTFFAFRTWVLAFTTRHGLRLMSLHGEAGSANMLNLSQELFELRENLRSYSISNIYNMDETGLFLRFDLRTSYVLEAEGRKSICGIKAMRAIDRVISFICTNADGSDMGVAKTSLVRRG